MIQLDPKNWVTSTQAAEILSTNSGHPVADAYVRQLARYGFIEVWALSSHVKLYNRADTEAYIVSTTRGRKKLARPIPA